MKTPKIILILMLWGAACRVHANVITLDTSTLPSTQGWEFITSGMHAGVAETDMFSTSGSILTMNSMNEPVNWLGGYAKYRLLDVVEDSKDTILEWTSRTTEYEITSSGGHDAGFHVALGDGQYRYLVGITKDSIYLDNGAGSHSLAFDATQYHTYRIETVAGAAEYDFYIDNTLQVTLTGKYEPSSNYLVFGDTTSTANARADISGLELMQIPEPSTIVMSWC